MVILEAAFCGANQLYCVMLTDVSNILSAHFYICEGRLNNKNTALCNATRINCTTHYILQMISFCGGFIARLLYQTSGFFPTVERVNKWKELPVRYGSEEKGLNNKRHGDAFGLRLPVPTAGVETQIPLILPVIFFLLSDK